MTRIAGPLAVLVALSTSTAVGSHEDQERPKRVCGRVLSVECQGASGPMTLRIGSVPDQAFMVTIPPAGRATFDAGPEDRYEDRTVCANVRAVKNRSGVLESASDLEVTSEKRPPLPSVASDVVRSCDPGVERPTLLQFAKAHYPVEAQRERLEGTVRLRLVVHADGTVGDVVILDRRFTVLDGAAIESVKQWRYKPGTRKGSPVPVALRAHITFTLR